MRKTIVPKPLKDVYENWHFAPAVVANGMIYCSGIIGTNPDGASPGQEALKGARATLQEADEALIAALQAIDVLGESVVIGGTKAADGWFNASFCQTFGVLDRYVLAPPVAMIDKPFAPQRRAYVSMTNATYTKPFQVAT